MRFAILFPLLALGLCLIARRHGGFTWLLLWPALSFVLVAIAYMLQSPRLFGKRANGALAFWSILLLLPYLLLSWLLWLIVRQIHILLSLEPCASQISPTLWVSRRPTTKELPPGVSCIVDLTCEFPAAHGLVKTVPHYFCLPTLDHGVPNLAQARALLDKLRTIKGGILIHCAQGHGRSALLAAAFLLATHAATNPDDALQIIKRHRPNIRLNRLQLRALIALNQPLLQPL